MKTINATHSNSLASHVLSARRCYPTLDTAFVKKVSRRQERRQLNEELRLMDSSMIRDPMPMPTVTLIQRAINVAKRLVIKPDVVIKQPACSEGCVPFSARLQMVNVIRLAPKKDRFTRREVVKEVLAVPLLLAA